MEWKLGHRRWWFWSRVQQHPTWSWLILFICVFCFHSLQGRRESLFSERLRGWIPQHPGVLRGPLLNLTQVENTPVSAIWLSDNNFTPFMWQLRWQFPESCSIYPKYLSSLVTDQRNAAFGNGFQLTWSCWSRVASETLSACYPSADRKTITNREASDSLIPCKL